MATVNRNAKYRIAKREKGLCDTCGKPKENRSKRDCYSCSEKAKQKRSAAIASGRCGYCGRPAIKGKTSCEKCLEYHNGVSRRIFADKRKNGRCAQCSSEIESGSYCLRCRERNRQRRRKAIDAGLCESCHRPRTGEFALCDACREKKKVASQRMKLEAFDAYGGAKCRCCGETELVFLTIDHVNNDGAKHRQEKGRKIYLWLKLNGYPAGFQVLCMNCNWAKRFGPCPHQVRERCQETTPPNGSQEAQ